MDKGTLLEWRVAPGDAVKKGDVVAVVDTTKAAIDVECWHDGTVEELLVEPGAEIPVGTVMARPARGGRDSGTGEGADRRAARGARARRSTRRQPRP